MLPSLSRTKSGLEGTENPGSMLPEFGDSRLPTVRRARTAEARESPVTIWPSPEGHGDLYAAQWSIATRARVRILDARTTRSFIAAGFADRVGGRISSRLLQRLHPAC